MNTCRRLLVSIENLLLPNPVYEALRSQYRSRSGLLYYEPQSASPFQIEVGVPLTAPHGAQRRWKSLAGASKQQQPSAGIIIGTGYDRPASSASLLVAVQLLHRQLHQGKTDAIRLQSQAVPGHGKEIQGGDRQHDLENEPRVKRLLDKLSKLFPGKKPGSEAPNIVGTLLQLHLTEKEVEAMFAKHRSLYSASFIRKKKANAASAQELIESLLARKMTRVEVGRMLKYDPYVLSKGDCRNCIEIVEYLADELKVERLAAVLRLGPTILHKRVCTLRKNVAFLQEDLGMQGLCAALQKFPLFLGFSIAGLALKAEALRRALGMCDLGALLDRYPTLLFANPAVPAATRRWLAATLGEAAAQKAVLQYPLFLSNKAEIYEGRLSYLRERLPGVDVVALFSKCPNILTVNPEALVTTHRWLAETFGEPALAGVVLKHPRLLTFKVPSLQAKLEFLTGDVGRSTEEVAAGTSVLARSLEGVLRPRCAAVRHLGLLHMFKLTTVFSTSEKHLARNLKMWAQPADPDGPGCVEGSYPPLLAKAHTLHSTTGRGLSPLASSQHHHHHHHQHHQQQQQLLLHGAATCHLLCIEGAASCTGLGRRTHVRHMGCAKLESGLAPVPAGPHPGRHLCGLALALKSAPATERRKWRVKQRQQQQQQEQWLCAALLWLPNQVQQNWLQPQHRGGNREQPQQQQQQQQQEWHYGQQQQWHYAAFSFKPSSASTKEEIVRDSSTSGSSSGTLTAAAPLDVATPDAFDKQYCANLKSSGGLLLSNKELYLIDLLGQLARAYAASQEAFLAQFALSMVKMSEYNVLTST
eukprot:jgi/Mesen1/5186/ME000257S04460